MILKFYGIDCSAHRLRELSKINRSGVTMSGLIEALNKFSFNAEQQTLTIDELPECQLPCILNWRLNHYVVLFKIKNKTYYIADPTKGIIRFSEEDLKDIWYSRKEFAGSCLIINSAINPNGFKALTETKPTSPVHKIKYISGYKGLLLQLALGFLLSSVFQLLTPVFTQILVDQGIKTANYELIYLILAAQLALALGSLGVNLVRSSVMLAISTKVNTALLTQFLQKLLKLPIPFFENRTEGDLIQRINDQQKIESFLTGTAITTFFSLFNLVIFGVLLVVYKSSIFLVFLGCTALYALWVLLFLKPKRELNYLQFENAAMNQSNVIEMINGIQDIKLNKAEELKRWDWERLQVMLFKYRSRSLKLSQLQNIGSTLINQLKNIIITFLSVKYVINGELTLGSMVAIQFIIGQINNPVEQFLSFLQAYQDAKISLDRMNEIYEIEDDSYSPEMLVDVSKIDGDININNLSFRYPVPGSALVLDNINLTIPKGKTTAIVGISGSGKTTLFKLLLKIFTAEAGNITIGEVDLNNISQSDWRGKCGTVFPDAYIFSDTIANNIALGDPAPDKERIMESLTVANLSEFVLSLPSGLETRIGGRGSALSLGQKQRLLIARAVYKKPDFVLFDEATNALDTLNEETVMSNLHQFFKGKTIVIIAHRMSTVKNADQIVVMNNAKIIEQGKHDQLVEMRGIYWQLIKNQLSVAHEV